MKLLLISPERKRDKKEPFLFKFGFLNLPYIAAVTPDEWEIEMIDEFITPITGEEQADLVALTAQTPVAPRAYKIAEIFRKRGIPVVMGGVHASLLPYEAKKYVDSVIIGEGEKIWHSVLDDFKRGELKPFYRQNGFIDLNDLPIPRRDLFKKNGYLPLKLIETTRGCPHHCDFCEVSRFFGYRYRTRSLDKIKEELDLLFPKREGIDLRKKLLSFISKDLPYFIRKRLLYIIDSNIVSNLSFSIKLFELLKKYDILWWGHASVSVGFNDKLLDKMAESGCIALNIGFESLKEENLRVMGKDFNKPKKYKEAIKNIHDRNIGIMGTFIIGLDQDTTDVFKEIYDFVYENQIDWALAFILTPYPTTESYKRLKKEGRILTEDWEKYDALNSVYMPKNMTPEQLEAGQRWLWKNIFSLSSIFRRILRRPWIHPLFYLGMNLQFFQMTRSWKVDGVFSDKFESKE